MKKIFGFEATAMLVFLALASGFPFVNGDTIHEKEVYDLDVQHKKDTLNVNTTTVRVEIKPIGYKEKTIGRCSTGSESNGYDVELPAEKADYVFTKLQKLDEAYTKTTDPGKRMMLFEEKLQVLREVGILPKTFTMENITKTSQWLHQFTYKHPKKSVTEYPGIFFEQPIIGFGVILISLNPLGEIVPIPIGSPIVFEASSKEIPLFQNEEGGNVTINITALVCAYSAEILLCHSALALNSYVTVLPPKSGMFIGSFYSVWLAVAGFSVTVYGKWYPEVILLDFDIFAGGFATIFPFHNCNGTR